YTRISRTMRESGFSPELGKVTEMLTVQLDTYLSEDAFAAGEQACAPPDTIQLNSDQAMILDQEQRNSVTGKVLAPAVRSPKLADFDAAAEKARQEGDSPDDVIKRPRIPCW